MSCGNPHDTDCGDVLDAVYAYLDGEMTVADHHVIAHHLDECSPCLQQFGIEQEVKALVARCCGSETASEELRSRVLDRLAQVRVEITQVEIRLD